MLFVKWQFSSIQLAQSNTKNEFKFELAIIHQQRKRTFVIIIIFTLKKTIKLNFCFFLKRTYV